MFLVLFLYLAVSVFWAGSSLLFSDYQGDSMRFFTDADAGAVHVAGVTFGKISGAALDEIPLALLMVNGGTMHASGMLPHGCTLFFCALMRVVNSVCCVRDLLCRSICMLCTCYRQRCAMMTESSCVEAGCLSEERKDEHTDGEDRDSVLKKKNPDASHTHYDRRS